MKQITDITLIESQSAQSALFILFGGPSCGVCKSIRPQLESMLKEHFPEIQSAYIDCETSPEICAQFSVFSLPVVKVFIEGKLVAEEFGAFSLSQLRDKLERYYSMWLSQ
ncbi:thioredoxin family protein [Cocleimonas flava]|uniref:Thioredoxin n=1 Tax=Cocleimonas flava TaxID=634765 RepID=A0A4V2P8Z9_9GAMM|nr:thioredoxin family protein [Cocleimonas flava]TCJ87695.1 thioredoxin [Cocleimonas flava]